MLMENTQVFNANIHLTEGEMSQFCAFPDDKISNKNRYYWRIPKGLPSSQSSRDFAILKFKLHNRMWEYRAFFSYCGSLNICIDTTNNDDHHFFDMQIGIVNDAHREFALKKATAFKTRRSIAIDLIHREELDSIRLSNEFLYIMLEMRRKDEEITHKMKDRKRKIEADFREFLLSGKSSDITIQVKKKKINCHRRILESRSPVFAAMMRYDMVEKANGLVIIKDAEPTIFQDFLLYLYSGNENYLNWKNVTKLYILSDKYAVEDLKILCVKKMKRIITKENFFEFFQMSQLRNDLKLTDMIVQFFFKNSKEIVKSESWIACLRKNPIESNVLITALVNKLANQK